MYGYALADPVNFIDPSGRALSDVDWGNVGGGLGLFFGGYAAIGCGAALIGSGWGAPLGYVGVAIGTGALISGAGLLGNEIINFYRDPFNPSGSANGSGMNVCSMK